MKYILIIVFIIILVIVLSSYFKLDITYYNIKNKKIDKNLKIMFLSDLHNRNLVNKINDILKKENVDLIILGGDMIQDSLYESDNYIKLIDSLENETLYYIYGNHEEHMKLKDEYTSLIKTKKLVLLNNKHIKLSNNIILYGLDSPQEKYLNFGKKALTKEYIFSELGELDSKRFNLLIAHNPLEFDSYVESNYDLVLSGHVHGGIIILPFIGGLLSPDLTFFPKYYKGKYTKNNTSMIVSRGLGFSKKVPFRFLNSGEVVIINLMKE